MLQGFLKMPLFRELINCSFLLLTIIIMVITRLKETVIDKFFLPRIDTTGYSVLIDGRNFYEQAITDQIKKYDKIRKIATGKGDDYTTGCLLDYQYFKDHYQSNAVDLSKQKELDVDPRTIQQIECYGKLETNSQVCTVLEKPKETVLEFYKETAKGLQEHING